jgi:predicted DNA-binding ribbon-helix-helix protein
MPGKSDIVRLNLRLTRDLYDRLVKSTHKHGTSLQTEVITRIEQTYGNHVPEGMLNAIRKAVEMVIAETGAPVKSVEMKQRGSAQAPRRSTMKSPIVKHTIVIAGHKTSVSLEDAHWKGLEEIASERSMTLSELVATIDSDRRHGNLSSAIRIFVLDHYRSLIGGERTAEPPVKKSA